MEFLPLRRMSPSESTPRRLATPATFRPQGFAPSRRIPPRSNARPCFMPVTPMGFRSSGVFPRCQVLRLVTEELPSWRFSSALQSKLRNPGRPISACSIKEAYVTSLCRLQGFAPTVNPYRRRTVTSIANGRSPPELSAPLQGLAHRFQATSRVTCAALALCPLALKQPAPGQARNQPQTSGARFSGFARSTGFHSEK